MDTASAVSSSLETARRQAIFDHLYVYAGFEPRMLAVMPLWYVKAVLRLAIRGTRWRSMEPLLDANLAEHRIVAALDGGDATRFSTITARTHLFGGDKSPDVLSQRLLGELAQAIPRAETQILPGLGHPAPEDKPVPIATAILITRS